MRIKSLTLGLSLLSLAAGSVEVVAERIAIHGSNTIGAVLMPSLVRAYAEERLNASAFEISDTGVPEEVTLAATDGVQGNSPLLDAEIHSHGSGTSFESLKAGSALIGMSSRPIKDREHEELQAAGLGDLRAYGSEHVVALDGLVVIVHPENPIAALDLNTIAQIFAGEITDWGQVGPGSGPIMVHARDDNSGTYDTFDALVLGPAGRALWDDAKRYESNEALSAAVAQDPMAIGFTGFAYTGNSKALALQGSCGLIFWPNRYLVRTEEYPLARRLFLYTASVEEDSQAADLLEFVKSDDAQFAISDAGFISQEIELLPFDEHGQRIAAAVVESSVNLSRLRSMIDKLRLAERASVTFRFNTNSEELDNKAQDDISRLARFLKTPAAAGRKVMLLGFADSVGGARVNKQLSYRRAQEVAKALAEQGVEADEVIGFGEIAPAACNDSENGRMTNRRVEVWLKS